MLPVSVTAVGGSNCTCHVIATPGFSVTGNVAPDTENPVPVRLAPFTVTAAVPVDVKVRFSVAAVPTGSLPKFKLVALSFNVGVPAAVPPVPLRDTLRLGCLLELLVIVSIPEAVPDVVGSNKTLNEVDWPGFRVTGNVAPVVENSCPLIVALLMMIASVPVDVMVIFCPDVVLSGTVPKVKLVGFTENVRPYPNIGTDPIKSNRKFRTAIRRIRVGITTPGLHSLCCRGLSSPALTRRAD